MTAYGTEFFSMNDVNRLRILQDVVDKNIFLISENCLREVLLLNFIGNTCLIIYHNSITNPLFAPF